MTEAEAGLGRAKDWLSISEACKYLNLSEPTIFRWMKAGKLSYFKVGKATRFKKNDLDLVVEKVVGQPEGEVRASRCAVCGHSRLVEGKVASTGNIYFRPETTRFFVIADSNVQVRAKCCPACGNIQLAADTAKLHKIMREDELSEEASAEEETANGS